MTIYRGYDITQADGQFLVSENGKSAHVAQTEDAAMSWVDADKKRKAQAKASQVSA